MGTDVKPQGVTITLPYNLELRDYQLPVWQYFMQDKPGLRGLVVWPRRNGKDLVSLNILIAKAMQRPGLYLYLGPLHTQTRQIVWLGGTDDGQKFLDFIPPQFVQAKRNAVMEVDLVNGSMIKVVGSDQYDSLMGLNCMGAVFTEYSLQRPEAWDYIRPMMAANGGWALFNGTPRGLNHMYEMKQMAMRKDSWFFQELTRDDTGRPTLESIQEEREGGMKESLIEQEFYCSWTASTESTFIPLDLIEPTIQRDAVIQEKDYIHEPRILGCDVAYAAKGDKAVIAFRQGRKVHYIRWYRGMDNMAFANEIDRIIKLVKPHAVLIDAGRGEGVISRLEQLGHSHLVRGVHFGGKVYEEGIADMKALMWTRMQKWFLQAKKPDLYALDEHPMANELVEEQLIKELSAPMMIIDEKNRIKVEPKTSLRQRGVGSPDLAEALCLTFAEEIEPEEYVSPRMEELGITQDMLDQLHLMDAEQSYDPLNYMDNFYGNQ